MVTVVIVALAKVQGFASGGGQRGGVLPVFAGGILPAQGELFGQAAVQIFRQASGP